MHDFLEQLLLVAVAHQHGKLTHEGTCDTPIGELLLIDDDRLLALPPWAGKATKDAILRPLALVEGP